MTQKTKKQKSANEWYHRNKEIVNEKLRNNLDLKEKKKEKYKNLSEEEKRLLSEKKKLYREKNKDKIKEQRKKYRENNKELIKERKRLYNKNKRITDPLFKLTGNIRVLIKNTLKYKNHKKQSKTTDILGCSFKEFKFHLEKLWSHPNNLDENGNVWMNWDNYGLYNGNLNYGWDIDHVIPTSSANTEEELLKLNHYSNLQPLCSKFNRDIKKDAI
jgi:phosphatidate phosphatase PAH1